MALRFKTKKEFEESNTWYESLQVPESWGSLLEVNKLLGQKLTDWDLKLGDNLPLGNSGHEILDWMVTTDLLKDEWSIWF